MGITTCSAPTVQDGHFWDVEELGARVDEPVGVDHVVHDDGPESRVSLPGLVWLSVTRVGVVVSHESHRIKSDWYTDQIISSGCRQMNRVLRTARSHDK
jgi:hypothetical protein